MNINKIDLMYLSNGLTENILKQDENKVDDKELMFYRKRVLQQTKELLRKKDINVDINNSFNNYLKKSIKYFKFIDKKELIQNEYNNLEKNKKEKIDVSFNIENSNEMMFKKVIVKNDKTLDDFVLKKNIKKKTKITIPNIKKYDITDKKFKDKGVRKKKKKN